MAYFIDGKPVRKHWHIVLTEAERHIEFLLNSGARTMADQWALWRKYKAGTGNLAAYPSPFAPHIRVGRQDHAIDVNSPDGGETRLQRWLEKNHVRVGNPVRGESWHMEANAGDLRKLAMRIQEKDRKLSELRGRAKELRNQIIADDRANRGTVGQRKLLDKVRADIHKYERWFA